MKKIIVIGLIICVIGAAGAYLLLSPSTPGDGGPAAADLLPADTLALVRLDDLENKIAAFRQGRLGQALVGIDWVTLMREMNAEEEDIQEFTRFREESAKFFDSLLFKEVFGKRVSLAFRPVEFPEKASPEELQKLLDGVVLISHPRHNTKLFEMVSKHFSAQLELRQETVDGWEISSFEIEEGPTIYFATVEGIIVATLGVEPLVTCLNLSRDPAQAETLAKTAHYQELDRRLFNAKQVGNLAYANLELLQAKGIDFLKAVGAEGEDIAELEDLFGELKGMLAVGSASLEEDPQMRHNQAVILIDKSRFSPVYANALATPPEENRCLTMTPLGTLLHGWQNNFDLEAYWQQIIAEGELEPEEIEAVKMQVRQFTGVALEEIIAAFGGEFAFTIKDVITGGMFPVPELVLLAESRNPEIFHQVLTNLANNLGTPLEQEEYKGAHLGYVMLPFGANISPAYTVHKDFFILATNLNLLKASVDTAEGGQNLVADSDFQAVDKGLSAKNNSMFYLHSARLTDRIQALAKWGGTMAAYGKPEEAQQVELMVNRVALPILEALKTYETMGMRSVINEDEIVSDFYIQLAQ